MAFFGKIKTDNAEVNTKKLTTEYCCRLLRTKKTQESHLIFCAAKKKQFNIKLKSHVEKDLINLQQASKTVDNLNNIPGLTVILPKTAEKINI